ncbi:carboxypeptidase-like regulatory domain-containing protein [Chryseobacterium sp. RG1]|uniref:Carboxypeptidase-like regulatory domain-containing protein n=1 Tax=Chryseobacterium tagetis TaxID=2801334 RepID=A0ABS7ZV30_9FLAO|nr:carboxypeptidase-like regulatory domain-containing protein [Chryseobacterium tagetis]MCA6065594.1 carboxypeptidase-like regulatory domain-containing protein [Chryseobacterium tagetis]
MQKFFFVIFFMLIFFLGKSQEIIIQIRDTQGKELDNINVQLLREGKIIDFKKTNNGGKYSFNPLEKGIFTLKFTSVFYKTKLFDIDTNIKTYFEIELESQLTEIKEVVIKSRPTFAKIKEDTIVYNVKAIRDGTERTVEDLVKKLPGLDISDNGKVTFKGNVIGEVLVEGNEFFGKNHKIAIQNLSSEMVDGIDFWKNYSTINGSTSTAINIKLKDDYKERITGNIEGGFGNKNSYLAHSNLYKLGKSGNLVFIGDVNNIAKDPITIADFYEMNKQENIEESENDNNLEVPNFLNNDGKVVSKDNQFGALQYSKSKKTFSITAFSIFNNAQLDKYSTTRRTVLDSQAQNLNFFEKKGENNKGFLGTTQIKARKVFNNDSFLFYNFGYTPINDDFNQDINRSSNDINLYHINNNIKSRSLGNFISWNINHGNNKIIFALSQLNKTYSGGLNIESNKNLFLTNNDFLTQNYDINSNKYAVDFYLKNKNKIINFNISSGFSYKKEKSLLEEFTSLANETRNLTLHHFNSDITVYRKLGRFDFSGSLSSNFIHLNEYEKHYFENKAKLKYLPDSKVNSEYSIEYQSKYNFPDIRFLQNNNLYSKDLIFYQNATIFPNVLSKTENYQFIWNRFNFDKGNMWLFVLLYQNTNPAFTTNVTNYGDFSKSENLIGAYNHRWTFLLSNDHKFRKNFNLKSKFVSVFNNNENFINNNRNVTSIQNFELSQKLSSNFKNKVIQFDIGYTFTKSIFDQSFYNVKSYQNYYKFSLGVRANIMKEWMGNLLGEYLIQNTEKNSQNNFLLGGQVSYRKEKTQLEYSLQFNNILNLNSFNYINSVVNQLGTDEYSTIALHGYFLAGLKLNF